MSRQPESFSNEYLDAEAALLEAAKLRDEAQRELQAREESWQRSDTDGFLSQWAHGLTAQLKLREAEIVEAGGVAEFPSLLDAATGERVRAKLVYVADRYAYGRKVAKWIVLDASDNATHWVPAYKTGKQSKLAKLGLVEGRETAPAKAFMDGEGHGLSGTAWVAVKRTDDGYPKGTRTLAEIRRS